MRLRPRIHVRRCVTCRERLNGDSMRLYGVGTVCPGCWTSIRAERRAMRAPLLLPVTHHHYHHDGDATDERRAA